MRRNLLCDACEPLKLAHEEVPWLLETLRERVQSPAVLCHNDLNVSVQHALVLNVWFIFGRLTLSPRSSLVVSLFLLSRYHFWPLRMLTF